jgi:hypothetical protein
MNANQEMIELANEVTRAICVSRVRNSSAFLSTGVSYPNGIGCTVRVHPSRRGAYFVSDDGYASFIANTMNAMHGFNRIAADVAKRSGVTFDKGAFLLSDIERMALPVAVGAVANASSRAAERLIASLEQPRIRRDREKFEKKLRAAFGTEISFDVEQRGATGRDWEFDAGLTRRGERVLLFTLVSPATQAVAIANMKISDTLAVPGAPKVMSALSDYEHTEPALRAILSNAGSTVIAANDDISAYRLAAA